MKRNRILHILVSIVFLFVVVGVSQPAVADTAITNPPDGAVVIVRTLTYWQGSFIGFVDAQTFEKWPFTLDQAQQFVVTAVPANPALTPLVILLDGADNELARGTGTLTAAEPAGNYAILIQPVAGAGFYQLTLRQVEQVPPTASPTATETALPTASPTPTATASPTLPPVASVITSLNPVAINIGDSAVATVSLSSVPAEGYTSAEFTCTYDAALAEVSNIADAGLFGTDAPLALNGPQNGSFIAAIAGSDSHRATTSGIALTFSLKGLQAGQTTVECKARVSKGDNVLTDIQSFAASLTINGTPTATLPPPTDTPTLMPTPTETAPIPSPTATPMPASTLAGQVHASKPVTVSLFNPDASLAASVTANGDGTFSLSAPAGSYTALASASGFLKAQGAVVLTAGQTTTLTTVSLLAGDIDGNDVIDQFDAMTIGMNYNAASPAAADLNNDGVINVLDLELLAHNYRAAGALAWQ